MSASADIQTKRHENVVSVPINSITIREKNSDKTIETQKSTGIQASNPEPDKEVKSASNDLDEVAFITIMWFDTLEQIKALAGEDYEKAVVHPTARTLLKKYDSHSRHFELSHELDYG